MPVKVSRAMATFRLTILATIAVLCSTEEFQMPTFSTSSSTSASPSTPICRDIRNRTVVYDPLCSQKNNLGCNAGGQGRYCRFCGFDKFPDCPETNETTTTKHSTELPNITLTTEPPVQQSPLYGVSYSPFRNSSSCADISDAMLDEDLDRLAPLVSTIRLRTMECDIAIRLLERARSRGLRLLLGLRLSSDETQFRADRVGLDRLLMQRTDLGHVIAVSVGQDPMSRGQLSETQTLEKVRDVRGLLRSYGYQTPVTTTDVFDKYNSYRLIDAVDVLTPNLRVFNAEISAEQSPRLLFDMIRRLRSWSVASGKQLFVETGWPTGGHLAASAQSAWSFLRRFRCQARDQGLQYFYFEAFDATWKRLGVNDVDSHWGLGTFDRRWKSGFIDSLRC